MRTRTERECRIISLRERKLEKLAIAAGNKQAAFKHHLRALHVPFDHHRAMVRRHARSRTVACFRSADGYYVDVIHPDMDHKGKWRVTTFSKPHGPSGHMENLTKEQAIQEIGRGHVPVSHKRAFAGWPVSTWTRRNPSRRKRKTCR